MIGTALVGYGWWGQHIAPRLQASRSFDLRGIVEPATAQQDAIRAKGFAVLDSYAAALADPGVQAVILTSPNDLHDAQIAQAVAAGKHVFCEKPLSLSGTNARRSVDTCRDAGLVLGIGHERRFEPAIVALRKMLDDGALGTVMHTEMAFSHDKLIGLGPDSWRTTKAFAPAAGMTQMGIHLTDLLIAFYGPVAALHAFTADRSLGWETGDVVTVQMQFKAGMTATLQAILHTPHFIRTHVFGSDMWVEIRNATHPDTPGGQATMQCYRNINDTRTKVFDWTDSVTANLEAFGTAIRGEAPYPYSDFELVHNIEVLDAIVQSADSGQAVQL
jgi:predicted dehydrogenase